MWLEFIGALVAFVGGMFVLARWQARVAPTDMERHAAKHAAQEREAVIVREIETKAATETETPTDTWFAGRYGGKP